MEPSRIRPSTRRRESRSLRSHDSRLLAQGERAGFFWVDFTSPGPSQAVLGPPWQSAERSGPRFETRPRARRSRTVPGVPWLRSLRGAVPVLGVPRDRGRGVHHALDRESLTAPDGLPSLSRRAKPLGLELLLLRGELGVLLPRREPKILEVARGFPELRDGAVSDVLDELLHAGLLRDACRHALAVVGLLGVNVLEESEGVRDQGSQRGGVRGLPLEGNRLPSHEHLGDATLQLEELELHVTGIVVVGHTFLLAWLPPSSTVEGSGWPGHGDPWKPVVVRLLHLLTRLGGPNPDSDRQIFFIARDLKGLGGGGREVSRGSREVSGGSRGVSGGCGEVSRGAREVSRGSREVSRGREEVSRGREEVSRGREEVSRGYEEVSRGREEVSITRRPPGNSRAPSSSTRRSGGSPRRA